MAATVKIGSRENYRVPRVSRKHCRSTDRNARILRGILPWAAQDTRASGTFSAPSTFSFGYVTLVIFINLSTRGIEHVGACALFFVSFFFSNETLIARSFFDDTSRI